MAGQSRLPVSKTSRYYVFDGLDKAEVPAAKYGTSSQVKQATRPRTHGVGEAWCNNADFQQPPATERLYMLDTYLMKAGEASCLGLYVLLCLLIPPGYSCLPSGSCIH